MLTGLITEVKSATEGLDLVSKRECERSKRRLWKGKRKRSQCARMLLRPNLDLDHIFPRVCAKGHIYSSLSQSHEKIQGVRCFFWSTLFFFFSFPCLSVLPLSFSLSTSLFSLFFPNQRHLHTTVPLFHFSHLLISQPMTTTTDHENVHLIILHHGLWGNVGHVRFIAEQFKQRLGDRLLVVCTYPCYRLPQFSWCLRPNWCPYSKSIQLIPGLSFKPWWTLDSVDTLPNPST